MISDNDQSAIEEIFLKSWDFIERFVADLSAYPEYKSGKQMGELIAELRSLGYDKKLRAGQSLTQVILSRSRKHGNLGQANLSFEFDHEGMTIRYYDPDMLAKIEVERVEFIPELELWLKRLVAHSID
ncbi:MAG: hypothetical protein K8I30_04805 [Anaerolineae bacterium]|nr:hypothetical protein [Anaerolineae bacterium]